MEDISIIGGADGPTAVFIASQFPWIWIGICVLAVMACVLAVLWLKKK